MKINWRENYERNGGKLVKQSTMGTDGQIGLTAGINHAVAAANMKLKGRLLGLYFVKVVEVKATGEEGAQ